MTRHVGEDGYLNMLRQLATQGLYRKPEGEEGRYELFAQSLRFRLLGNRIPLLTTKKVNFKALAVEMLWFLRGDQDIKFLHDHNVHIWDAWANDKDEVGPLYGYQWRHWHGERDIGGMPIEIDQVAQVMQSLRDRPEARSHVITAWRPDHLQYMSIKPCHILLQFYRFDHYVSLVLFQRSCDAFLGVPFNIAQYSLLTHMVAHQLGCMADEFIWHGADVHLYENHLEQVKQQTQRHVSDPPKVYFKRKPQDIFSYEFDDFELDGYNPAGPLKGEVSLQGKPGEGITI